MSFDQILNLCLCLIAAGGVMVVGGMIVRAIKGN